MPVEVIQQDPDEIRAERDALLAELRMTRAELEQAAEEGLLIGQQFWHYRRIQSLEFLLGEEV